MFLRIEFIGHVGQDPKMRYTPSGTPVTDISVACKETVSKTLPNGSDRPCPDGWTESYNKNNWEVTTWIRVTCWRGLAETVNNFVTKGMLVFVEGTLNGDASEGKVNPRVWTGNDGIARCNFEVTARNVRFLSRAGNGGQATTSRQEPPEDSGWGSLNF